MKKSLLSPLNSFHYPMYIPRTFLALNKNILHLLSQCTESKSLSQTKQRNLYNLPCFLTYILLNIQVFKTEIFHIANYFPLKGNTNTDPNTDLTTQIQISRSFISMNFLADRQIKEKLLQMITEAAVIIRVSQARNKLSF